MDRSQSRLALASQLGATHTIDTTPAGFDMTQAVRKLCPQGITVVVDTTGVGKLIEGGLQSASNRGKLVLIAPPQSPEYKLSIDLAQFITVRIRFN